MKKMYFLTAIAAIGMMAGCSKQEIATTPEEPQLPAELQNTPVKFGLSSLALKSKASGTVGSTAGADNVWNGQTLFIYSYDRTVTDFTADAFIENVQTTAPENVASGVIDITNANYNNEPYYYGSARAYDFYGYHVDDAATAAPTKETARVYVPFTIDGGQDLMIAKANPEEDIKNASADKPVAADRAYSAYAARRNVQPNLLFQHQLARFTFEIVAGSSSGNDVFVNAVEVTSKTTGKLVVVGATRGIADVEETTAPLALKQYNTADKQLVGLEPVQPNAWVEARDNEKSIGESLMVIPGETSYALEVSLSKDQAQTPMEPIQMNLEASKLTGAGAGAAIFEAGKSYKVTIVIYGPEKIEITASLEPWVEGGDIVIDPDEE